MTTEYTREEDIVLMDNYYDLDRKGLYIGSAFWDKLRLKMSWQDDLPNRTWQDYKMRVEYLYKLGPEMKTYEEKYFDETGLYYEDDYLYFEEEEEEEEIESDYDNEYY